MRCQLCDRIMEPIDMVPIEMDRDQLDPFCKRCRDESNSSNELEDDEDEFLLWDE